MARATVQVCGVKTFDECIKELGFCKGNMTTVYIQKNQKMNRFTYLF